MYNKFQYHKLNDRKTLKKVKKQWVVTSTALLAVDGTYQDQASAHTEANNYSDNYFAHSSGAADDHDSTSAASLGGASYDQAVPSNSVTPDLKPSSQVNASVAASSTVPVKSNSASQVDADFNEAFQAGFSAASTAIDAGQVVQYHDANYNAGIDAYYAVNAGAVAAWNRLHPDDVQTAYSAGSFAATNSYYASGFAMVSSAFKHYQKLNHGLGTQPNYGEAANQPLKTGSVQRGTRVKLTALSPNDELVGDAGQYLVATEALTFFWSRQGAYDAEAGKWNAQDQAGTYTAFDRVVRDRFSDHPYVQAYQGAQAAMVNEWSNRDFQTVTGEADSLDVNYRYGYRDVQSKVNHQGIVFITDGDGFQLNHAFATKPDNSDYQLRLTTDIYYTGNSDVNQIITGNDVNVIVDGQNHIADLGAMNNYLVNVASLQIQNFRKLYGTGAYGPISLPNSTHGSLTYANVNYEGGAFFNNDQLPQLYIEGAVNVISASHYISPFAERNVSGHEQPNLRVNNLELCPHAQLYAIAEDGNNIEVLGSLKLSDHALMNLTPHGQIAEDTLGSGNHGHRGLVLLNETVEVEIDSQAQLLITPGDRLAAVLTAPVGTSIDLDGGRILVRYIYDPLDEDPLVIAGTMTVKNNGNLNVHGTNRLVKYGGNLVTVTGSLNINNRGNLAIYTDGKTTNEDLTLLNNPGTVTFDNPGKRVLFSKNGYNNQFDGQGAGDFFYQMPIAAYEVSGQVDHQISHHPRDLMGIGIRNTPFNGIKVLRKDGTIGSTTSLKYFNNSTSQYLVFHAVPTVYFAKQIQLLSTVKAASGYSVVINLRVTNTERLANYDDRVYVRVTTNTHDELPVGQYQLIEKPHQTIGNGQDGDYRNGYTIAIPISEFTDLGNGVYGYRYVRPLNATELLPNDVEVDAQLGVTNQSSSIANNDNGDTYYANVSHNPARGPITNVRGVIKGKITDNIIVPDHTPEDSRLAASSASLAMLAANTASGYASGFSADNGNVALSGAGSYAIQVSYAFTKISANSEAIRDMSASVDNNQSAHSNQSFSATTAGMHQAVQIMTSLHSTASSQNEVARLAASIAFSCAELSSLEAISASSEARAAVSARHKFASLARNYFIRDKSQLERTASGEANSAATAAGSYENSAEVAASTAKIKQSQAAQAATKVRSAEINAVNQLEMVQSLYDQIIDPNKTASSAEVATDQAQQRVADLTGINGIRKNSQAIDRASLSLQIVKDEVTDAKEQLTQATSVLGSLHQQHSQASIIEKASSIMLSATDTLSSADHDTTSATQVISNAQSMAQSTAQAITHLTTEVRSATVDAHNENSAAQSAMLNDDRSAANAAAIAASEAAVVSSSAAQEATQLMRSAAATLTTVQHLMQSMTDVQSATEDATHALNYVVNTVLDEFDDDVTGTSQQLKADLTNQLDQLSSYATQARQVVQSAAAASDGVMKNHYQASAYEGAITSLARKNADDNTIKSTSVQARTAQSSLALFVADASQAHQEVVKAASTTQSVYHVASSANATLSSTAADKEASSQPNVDALRSVNAVTSLMIQSASGASFIAQDAYHRTQLALRYATSVTEQIHQANQLANQAEDSLFANDTTDGVESAARGVKQALADTRQVLSNVHLDHQRASSVATVAQRLSADHVNNDSLQSAAGMIDSAYRRITSVVSVVNLAVQAASAADQRTLSAASQASTASLNGSFYNHLLKVNSDQDVKQHQSTTASAQGALKMAHRALTAAQTYSQAANSANVRARTNSGIARAAINSAVSAQQILLSAAAADSNGSQITIKANRDVSAAVALTASNVAKLTSSYHLIQSAVQSVANVGLMASQAASEATLIYQQNQQHTIIKSAVTKVLAATSYASLAHQHLRSYVHLASAHTEQAKQIQMSINDQQDLTNSMLDLAISATNEQNSSTANSAASQARSAADQVADQVTIVMSLTDHVDILNSKAQASWSFADQATVSAVSANKVAKHELHATSLEVIASQAADNVKQVTTNLDVASSALNTIVKASQVANQASNGLNVNSSKASSAASAAVSRADANFGEPSIASAANVAKRADNQVRKAAIEEYAANDDLRTIHQRALKLLDQVNLHYQTVTNTNLRISAAAHDGELSAATQGQVQLSQATNDAQQLIAELHQELSAVSSVADEAQTKSTAAYSAAAQAIAANLKIQAIINNDQGPKATAFAGYLIDSTATEIKAAASPLQSIFQSAVDRKKRFSTVQHTAQSLVEQARAVNERHQDNIVVASQHAKIMDTMGSLTSSFDEGSYLTSALSASQKKITSADDQVMTWSATVSSCAVVVSVAAEHQDQANLASGFNTAHSAAHHARFVLKLVQTLASRVQSAERQLISLESDVNQGVEAIRSANALAISAGVVEDSSVVSSASAATNSAASGVTSAYQGVAPKVNLIQSLASRYPDDHSIADAVVKARSAAQLVTEVASSAASITKDVDTQSLMIQSLNQRVASESTLVNFTDQNRLSQAASSTAVATRKTNSQAQSNFNLAISATGDLVRAQLVAQSNAKVANAKNRASAAVNYAQQASDYVVTASKAAADAMLASFGVDNDSDKASLAVFGANVIVKHHADSSLINDADQLVNSASQIVLSASADAQMANQQTLDANQSVGSLMTNVSMHASQVMSANNLAKSYSNVGDSEQANSANDQVDSLAQIVIDGVRQLSLVASTAVSAGQQTRLASSVASSAASVADSANDTVKNAVDAEGKNYSVTSAVDSAKASYAVIDQAHQAASAAVSAVNMRVKQAQASMGNLQSLANDLNNNFIITSAAARATQVNQIIQSSATMLSTIYQDLNQVRTEASKATARTLKMTQVVSTNNQLISSANLNGDLKAANSASHATEEAINGAVSDAQTVSGAITIAESIADRVNDVATVISSAHGKFKAIYQVANSAAVGLSLAASANELALKKVDATQDMVTSAANVVDMAQRLFADVQSNQNSTSDLMASLTHLTSQHPDNVLIQNAHTFAQSAVADFNSALASVSSANDDVLNAQSAAASFAAEASADAAITWQANDNAHSYATHANPALTDSAVHQAQQHADNVSQAADQAKGALTRAQTALQLIQDTSQAASGAVNTIHNAQVTAHEAIDNANRFSSAAQTMQQMTVQASQNLAQVTQISSNVAQVNTSFTSYQAIATSHVDTISSLIARYGQNLILLSASDIVVSATAKIKSATAAGNVTASQITDDYQTISAAHHHVALTSLTTTEQIKRANQAADDNDIETITMAVSRVLSLLDETHAVTASDASALSHANGALAGTKAQLTMASSAVHLINSASSLVDVTIGNVSQTSSANQAISSLSNLTDSINGNLISTLNQIDQYHGKIDNGQRTISEGAHLIQKLATRYSINAIISTAAQSMQSAHQVAIDVNSALSTNQSTASSANQQVLSAFSAVESFSATAQSMNDLLNSAANEGDLSLTSSAAGQIVQTTTEMSNVVASANRAMADVIFAESNVGSVAAVVSSAVQVTDQVLLDAKRAAEDEHKVTNAFAAASNAVNGIQNDFSVTSNESSNVRLAVSTANDATERAQDIINSITRFASSEDQDRLMQTLMRSAQQIHDSAQSAHRIISGVDNDVRDAVATASQANITAVEESTAITSYGKIASSATRQGSVDEIESVASMVNKIYSDLMKTSYQASSAASVAINTTSQAHSAASITTSVVDHLLRLNHNASLIAADRGQISKANQIIADAVDSMASDTAQMKQASNHASAASVGIDSANSGVSSAVQVVSEMVKNNHHSGLSKNLKLIGRVNNVISSALADEKKAATTISQAYVAFTKASGDNDNILNHSASYQKHLNSAIGTGRDGLLSTAAIKTSRYAQRITANSSVIKSTTAEASDNAQVAVSATDAITSAAKVIEKIADNQVILDAIAVSSAVDNVKTEAASASSTGSIVLSLTGKIDLVANNVDRLADKTENKVQNNVVVNVLSAANHALSAASTAVNLNDLVNSANDVMDSAITVATNNIRTISQNAEDANSAAIAATSESDAGKPSTASAYNDIYISRSQAVSSATQGIDTASRAVKSANQLINSAHSTAESILSVVNSESVVATEQASLAYSQAWESSQASASATSAEKRRSSASAESAAIEITPAPEIDGGPGADDFFSQRSAAHFTDQRYQAYYNAQYQDAKLGYEQANINVGAVRTLAGYSRAYQKGYLESFKRQLAHTTLYIYLKDITTYLHSAVYFTPFNRTAKLTAHHLKSAYEFKVLTVAIDDNGLLRYLIESALEHNDNQEYLKGYISTSHDLVENAYYQRSDLQNEQRAKVIANRGILVHNNPQLVDGIVRHLRNESIVQVKQVIVGYDGTSLMLDNGQYITANKRQVQLIK